LKIGKMDFDIGNRTYIMGILNVTPDSFSDGGEYDTVQRAVERALRMEAEGADIIDVGGESTRPGHVPISSSEELSRILPVLEALREKLEVPISVDTYKADVAAAAVDAGAGMINDVWGLKKDPRMAAVVAEKGVALCAMHNQDGTEYRDLMGDLIAALEESVNMAREAGVDEDRIVVDPGIGFGKTVEQNIEVMRKIDLLGKTGRPWLLGTSRKSLIGKTLNLPMDQRMEATIATNVLGIRGGADFIRVHDVLAHRRAAAMTDRIVRPLLRKTHYAYIAMGSNLGKRLEHLRAALAHLEEIPSLQLLRVSNLYETSPVGYTEQESFLNAVVVCKTELNSHELLRKLLAIETKMGRKRELKWGPRNIDLDLLIYDDEQRSDPSLELPHPRMHERLFVLKPLCDVAPLLVHPSLNRRIFELLRSLDFQDQKLSLYAENWAS